MILIQLMTMHFLAHCASPATETLTELVAVIIREHYFIMLLAKMHDNIIYHHFDVMFSSLVLDESKGVSGAPL